MPAHRRCLLVAGLCLLAAGSGASCRAEGVGAGRAGFRVMTFNIHAGHGDLERVAHTIREADPDVVGLQEVDVNWAERSGFVDQAALLAAWLGMEFRFAPIYVLPAPGPDRPPRQFGVAILSRHPIVSWHNHEITRLSTQAEAGPRPMPGFLQVTIDLAGTKVDVFDTHLDFRPDPAVRARQAADMLAIIGDRKGPTILLGDLNAPPDSEELRPLFTRFGDAWTRSRAPGHTYPGDAPVRRIDYVLFSGLRVVAARVPVTDASDHRPVVVDFDVGTRNRGGPDS